MTSTIRIGLLLAVFILLLIFGAGLASAQSSPGQSGGSTAADWVQVGEPAPDFTLAGYPEDSFTLSDHRGHTVVLFFYPKDNTTVCTAEAVGFTELSDEFEEAGAYLYGISRDSIESHQEFSEEHGLGVTLLSDSGGRVRRLYGNPDGSTPLSERVTYVIDGEGIVRHIIVSDEAEDHYEGALAWAQRIDEEDMEASETATGY